jgi:hypothetical protein
MAKGKRSVASALFEIDRRLDADDFLSADDRAQIKEKAREHVRKKRRDAAEAALLAREIRNEEIALNPLEQYENVEIDIAPYAPFISLDGTMYFHGISYNVPYSVARTIDDISARTWEHQNEISGRRRRADIMRRPRELTVHQADSEASRRAGVLAQGLNTRARPDQEV